MAVYFMSGKTFLKDYVEEDPDVVSKTHYILITSTLRHTRKYKNVTVLSGALFPEQELLVDYTKYKKDKNYKKAYLDYLNTMEAMLGICLIIKYGIEGGYPVVLLCGEREKKFYYMELIQKFIEDNFDYHIYDYKKLKKGKYDGEMNDEETNKRALDLCNKYLKKVEKEALKKKLSTEEGRKDYVKKMPKKKVAKELKKMGLYSKSMSTRDMRDTLATFI